LRASFVFLRFLGMDAPNDAPAPELRRRPPTRRGRSSSSHLPNADPACPPPAPRAASHSPQTPNIFVNYLPRHFTEADLCALCSEYGTIVTSKIMIHLETGESKGFGFVRFANLAQAQAAVDGLNGRHVDTKRLLAKFAESREKQDRASPMLYIKRLPLTVDQRVVVELFARFGEIAEAVPHILDTVDPQFWRLLIKYAGEGEAAAALAAMNNQIIAPGTCPIHVRYADAARIPASFRQIIPFVVPPLIEEQGTAQLLPSFLLC
jgi:ELAV like protein 2/3/4